jgi:hypothetical protein
MNHYRIIEDGNGYYYVQQRFLWLFWLTGESVVTERTLTFRTLEEARKLIADLRAAEQYASRAKIGRVVE